MADDLTAALDQIRERGYRNGATGALCGRLSDAAAVDVPRLLAAIDEVLAIHESAGSGTICGYCVDSYGEPVEWPCPTCQAITRALVAEPPA